jgi:hypothetical protein
VTPDARRPVGRGVIAWGLLFGAIVALYAATFSFRNISDTDLNSYQTRALALHGDVRLDRYGDKIPNRRNAAVHDGRRYSIYGVGVSLPALPIYAIAARRGASDRALQAAASIPFVAASALILLRVLLRLVPRGVAVGAFTVYAFGTTMWPVAAMGFFQTGPIALFQALGLAGVFSRGRWSAVLAGSGFGAAAMVRPTLLIPLFAIGVLYLIEERGQALLCAVAAIPPLAVAAVQNRWIWGSWASGGYSHAGVGFHADVPRALFGQLFGWYRGIFVYSPVLIVAAAGCLIAARMQGFVERRIVVLGLASLALILFNSRWSAWYGGTNQFGYRLLLDIVPFLVILMAYGVARSDRLRTIALPLGVLSVMTMAFGAAPNDFGWDGKIFPKEVSDTSFGQAWINFVHHPAGGVLRVLGVVALAFAAYAVVSMTPRPRTTEGDRPPGREVFVR